MAEYLNNAVIETDALSGRQGSGSEMMMNMQDAADNDESGVYKNMLPDINNGSKSVIKSNNVVKRYGVGENRSYSSIAFAQPKGRMNFGTSD